MTTLVTDQELERDLRRRRRKAGTDRWDEVWDGVYVMAAMPNNEHQAIANKLLFAFESVLGQPGRGLVFPGVNISDRPERWKRNYRCPDVAVFLPGNTAVDRATHWFGGPDFAVEVVSPGEDPHGKLGFYAKVHTRELLVIDRDPWRLELFRLTDQELKLAAVSVLAGNAPGAMIVSEVVPFRWRVLPGSERPRVEVTCTETGQVWNA